MKRERFQIQSTNTAQQSPTGLLPARHFQIGRLPQHVQISPGTAGPDFEATNTQHPLVEYQPSLEFAKQLEREGMAAFPIVSLPPGCTAAELFRSAAADARASHGPLGACLHLYEVSEYARMRLFIDRYGRAGFALKGSEIVSVFNHREGPRRLAARNLLRLATQLGGTRFDAFNTGLPSIYARCGFGAVSYLTWSDLDAPNDWDYNAMVAFNHGRPDVVFMALGCLPRSPDRVLTYSAGVETQLAALAANQSEGVLSTYV